MLQFSIIQKRVVGSISEKITSRDEWKWLRNRRRESKRSMIKLNATIVSITNFVVSIFVNNFNLLSSNFKYFRARNRVLCTNILKATGTAYYIWPSSNRRIEFNISLPSYRNHEWRWDFNILEYHE